MYNLNSALEALYFAHRALIAKPDAILARHGLSRGHHRILFFVGRNPKLSINDLLTKLGVCKQSINAPLRKLQQMGLINSVSDSRDKRIKRLSLSPSGAILEDELTEDQRRRLAKAFAAVGGDIEPIWFNMMAELAR